MEDGLSPTPQALQGDRRTRISGGWPLVFLSSLVVFIDSVGYGVVVPVLPLYATEMGISEFQVGFLFATYAIAVLAGSIPIGLWSDRTGRKPFVLFGMFAMAGAFVFYAFADTYLLLVIARIADGLTAAATWTVALALVGDRIGKGEMGEKMGYVMGAAAAGGIAGPVIGGILSDSLGYRAPFYFIAAVCVTGGTIAVFLEERRDLIKRTRTRVADALGQVFKNRVVMLACLVTVITTMGFGLLEPTFPIFLQRNFDLSRTGIGLIFGAMTVFFAAASPFAGVISDRAGRRLPILAGLALTAVLAPLLSEIGSLAALYVLMSILGIGFALFSTPVLPLVTDALFGTQGETPVPMGTAFGVVNLAWSLGYALGPLVGGAIMGRLGLSAALRSYSLLLLTLIVLVGLLLVDRADNRSGTR